MLPEHEVVRFGVYTADLRTAELKKGRDRIRVQNLPFHVLTILLHEPGRTVTREELRRELWPDDTFVDFERGISTAVSKLREALGDSANNPRFIETVGRRGYRFIAPVGVVSSVAPESPANAVAHTVAPVPINAHEVALSPKSSARALQVRKALIGLGSALIAAVLLSLALSARQPVVVKMIQVTNSGKAEHSGGLHTDGSRIYFLEKNGTRWTLMQTSLAGGEVTSVASPFPNTKLVDISPDRSEMLITTVVDYLGKHALWIMPIEGGTPQRVGDIMVDQAAWFPDGKRLLCSHDAEVFSVAPDGTDRRHLFNIADGEVFRLSWKPDGTSFRFSVWHSNDTVTLWEASANGTNPHLLLPGWNDPPNECCGSWTADGKGYVFRSNQHGQEDLWLLREPSRLPWIPKPKPLRLTNGPTSFSEPLVSADGRKIFALGLQARGYVARFDERQREFVPFPLPPGAFDLAFSHDGQWVAYVERMTLTLWRTRIDGSERLQLTSSPMKALRPRWSHDGKLLLFNAHLPDRFYTPYTISADGGAPQAVLQKDDVYWQYVDFSPDGESIVMGPEPGMYPDAGITVMDLRTRDVSEFRDSKGIRLPRWSPKGDYMAGASEDAKTIFLFDNNSQKWKQITRLGQVSRFEWERDGSYLYYQDIQDPGQAVFRVQPKTGKIEKVIDFASLLRDGAVRVGFEGRAPDGSIVASVASSWADLYSFDVDLR